MQGSFYGMMEEQVMKGFIFDMDGVLFDTEKLYERFWCEAAEELGFVMNVEDVAAIRSTDAKLARKILKQRCGSDFDYDGVKGLRIRLMHEYTQKHGVEQKPGVRDFLVLLKGKNYKIALATTSNKKRATEFLMQGKLFDFFDWIVSGDLVTKGKPDPEIYLKAAEGLGLNPAECYAVEDSYNGVRSAHAAGCKVIMVPDRDVPDAEMREKTIQIAASLDKIVLSGLQIRD